MSVASRTLVVSRPFFRLAPLMPLAHRRNRRHCVSAAASSRNARVEHTRHHSMMTVRPQPGETSRSWQTRCTST